MKILRFDGLLQQQGWIVPAYVTVDVAGRISSINTTGPDKVDEIVRGWALPTIVNAHSHAFQYAMVPLAENSSSAVNNFWNWRNLMYTLANKINPDQLEAVAQRVYSEMLRLGYGWVTEFHYLHHDKKGRPYNNQTELSERLIYAAHEVGIGITLVPVYYKNSNFGTPALEQQKRFVFTDIDHYLKMVDKLRQISSRLPKVNIASGVHSLRAADEDEIIHIMNQMAGPKHLHIAEQAKEVHDCIAALGTRPVEWLCNHIEMNDSVNVIHATHIDGSEKQKLTGTKANVVLCPSTEANLGDGLFALTSYALQHGRWCIGSDSQVRLDPFEELRWLDYTQRLFHQNRISFCKQNIIDSSPYAFRQVVDNGRLAAGLKAGDYFEVGQFFDCVVFSTSSVLIDVANVDNLLSTIIYNTDCHDILGTIISGNWQVSNQQHRLAEKIDATFKKALLDLWIV